MNELLQNWLGVGEDMIGRVLATFIIVGLVVALRLGFLSLVKRRGTDTATRYRLRRISGYVAGTLSILAIGAIWLRGLQAVATYAGLLSAGIAIALKDVMANFAGWIFILWRRPFELGDRIEIAGVRGDVVDIRMFQHSLMEIGNWIDADDRTGRVLHVPNATVLNGTVANYTKGWFIHIWDELAVLITHESNWEEARRLLLSAVEGSTGQVSPTLERGATAHYLVMDASVRATVFVAVKPYGIELTARFVCDPRQRRGTKQAIWEALLRVFAKRDDIAFAYPTQRFYDNAAEGKPGLRPPRT